MSLLLLAITSCPAAAVDLEKIAPGTSIEGTVGLDWASAYVFRGMTVNKNPVLQPSLKLQSGGLTVGAWGNRALNAEENEIEQELDAFASFDIPFDALTLSLGYTEYMYPDSDFDNDQEIMARISFAGLLNPSLSAFRGVGGGILDSSYYELGLKQEVFAQNDVSATLGGTLAWLDRETGEDGLSHFTVSAGVTYKVIAVSAHYAVETDEEVNDLDEQEPFFMTSGASFTF
jgi:uncharacterized protein (TIGR02001 family)